MCYNMNKKLIIVLLECSIRKYIGDSFRKFPQHSIRKFYIRKFTEYSIRKFTYNVIIEHNHTHTCTKLTNTQVCKKLLL